MGLRPKGARQLYSMENPDWVPTPERVTIIERAKKGTWSERLKETVTDDVVSSATNDEDLTTNDEVVRSVLRALDEDFA